MRLQCEPKSNQNPRYLRHSNAVSALRWIIDDLAKEVIARPDRFNGGHDQRFDYLQDCRERSCTAANETTVETAGPQQRHRENSLAQLIDPRPRRQCSSPVPADDTRQ